MIPWKTINYYNRLKIGEEITIIRRDERKWTRLRLAREIDLKFDHLGDIENGSCSISNGERERIEIIFGLPTGYLASLPQLMDATKLKDSKEVRRMFEYVLTHLESCCLPKDNQIYEAILAEKREYYR